MSFVAISAVVAAGATVGSVAIQANQAKKQREAAAAINPVEPGPNQSLQDNARMLKERYGNYVIPGFDAARADINLASQMAFNNAAMGATSSSDVLDAAARIAYGSQRSIGDLYRQNAAAKDQAFLQYLNANESLGRDDIAWRRQQYLYDMERRAQLTNAAMLNEMNAWQSGLSTVGSLASYGAGIFANKTNEKYNSLQQGDSGQGTIGYINQPLVGAEVERKTLPPTLFAKPVLGPPAKNYILPY